MVYNQRLLIGFPDEMFHDKYHAKVLEMSVICLSSHYN